MFGVIKQANGNVLFLGVGVNLSITPVQNVKQFIGTVIIEDAGRTSYSFAYNQVSFYSLDGGTTKTPAPCTIEEFIAILQTSFFLDAANSGSFDITGSISINPSAEDSAAIIATPTATVTFGNITKVGILRFIPTLNCIVQGIDSTGIATQQLWWAINDSAFTITLPEENINPSPHNRFVMSGTSQTLPAGGSLPMMYDLSVNRFRLMTKS